MHRNHPDLCGGLRRGTLITMDEVADRVFVAHHEYLQVNVGIVAGDRGLVVIDTLWSERAARALAEQLAGPVVAVVNTHDHWDHVLGNAAFTAPIHAHEEAAAAIGRLVPEVPYSQHAEDIAASRVVVPEQTFSSVATIDLGDRLVELVHPGRGHTAGDIVVRVADADVLLAGDLVEESADPAYGPDCFPLEWPASLDLVTELIGERTLVVPGHGAPVDQAFVQTQRAEIGAVAETIRDLASRDVPVSDALGQAAWPFDPSGLEQAVRRAYEQLPRSVRALPLI
jgi:glyoxylase-like metal-dependent hydrolase (beta-lactamase superfamily II)